MSRITNLKKFLTLPTFLILSVAVILAGPSFFKVISQFNYWDVLDTSNGYGFGYGYGCYTWSMESDECYGYDYGYGYGYNANAIAHQNNGGSAGAGSLFRGNNESAEDVDQNVVTNSLENFLNSDSHQGNIENSPFSDEINSAYQYAYALGITTMGDVASALPEQGTTRAQLAKMMVQFANNALGKHMDASRIAMCSSYADVDASLGDLKDFITAACASKIMGLEVDEDTPLVNFDPNKIVSRGEIVTVLGRLILNHAYENMDPYYAGYMNALLDATIITVNDPTLLDSRANIWIILERAHKWLAGK